MDFCIAQELQSVHSEGNDASDHLTAEVETLKTHLHAEKEQHVRHAPIRYHSASSTMNWITDQIQNGEKIKTPRTVFVCLFTASSSGNVLITTRELFCVGFEAVLELKPVLGNSLPLTINGLPVWCPSDATAKEAPGDGGANAYSPSQGGGQDGSCDTCRMSYCIGRVFLVGTQHWAMVVFSQR